ncbi:hypothetical protein LguiB_020077 [Lonicera macranthoides]
MPHLRAKARPSLGFGDPKPNDVADASNRLNCSGTGMLGLSGNNSRAMPPLVKERKDGLYLVAQRLTIERQRSMPSSSVNSGVGGWSNVPVQEQSKPQVEAEMAGSEISTSLSNTNFSTPWAGVIANSDNKSFSDIQPDAAGSAVLQEGSLNQKSKKSQLHDLLAEEALPKSNEREVEVPAVIHTSMSPLPVTSSQSDVIEDNFIEAKDTKKSRKKSAKAKNVGTKKEVLPVVPSGPSLGDFVWKGETANPSYVPAWSTDSGKKSQPTQPTRGSGPSWSGFTASAPAKSASSIQTITQPSSQSKHKLGDDFFWGPVDQAKQDAKQFSLLHGEVGFSSSCKLGQFGQELTSKRNCCWLIEQTDICWRKPVECSISSLPSSAHSSLKGKKNTLTNKHSDKSFLKFCLKQSRSEAKILLTENLGSYDPDHKFIDKFLNFKDFIPADVLEIAFQSPGDQRKVTRDANEGGYGNVDQGIAAFQGVSTEGEGGRRIKGRKERRLVHWFWDLTLLATGS